MWCVEEEEYLSDLACTCQELSQKFKTYHEIYKRYQTNFRIPNIVISSLGSLISFSSVNWTNNLTVVTMVTGAMSLTVALLTSLETYFKLGDIINGAVAASANFQKLAEQITVELALPRTTRQTTGVVFVKECHLSYEKYWEAAPTVIKRVRFIRRLFSGSADKATVSLDTVSQDEETPPPPVTPHSTTRMAKELQNAVGRTF
jgi:hypothetical protein